MRPVLQSQAAECGLACLAMVPACVLLARWHVLLAVAGGAVVYVLMLAALRALPTVELRKLLARS